MLPLIILLMACIALFSFVIVMTLAALLGVTVTSQIAYILVVLLSVTISGGIYLLVRKPILKEKEKKPNWTHIALGALIAAILIVGIPFVFSFLNIQSVFSQNIFSVESVTAQANLYGVAPNPTVILLSGFKPQLYLGCVLILMTRVSYFAWTGNR